MSGDRLTELLDAATADVPARHSSAPLAAIAGRIRRRRVRTAAVAGAAVLAVLLGGFAAVRGVVAGPPVIPPGAPSRGPSTGPTRPQLSADPAAVPWFSAFVARDDRTVTVYSGTAGCHELAQSQARLAVQDAEQVVIGVYARVVDAADCTTAGQVVPLVVTLTSALGSRLLLDAAGASRPVYHEWDLPDLRASGWTPVAQVTWLVPSSGWHNRFNGPGGGEIVLAAWHTDKPVEPERGEIIIWMGGHQGTITATGAGGWRVSWPVGDVTYQLDYVPAEGGSFSLTQFGDLLTGLRWD
jgi:hypothetical protein